jgi:hypothetical protein
LTTCNDQSVVDAPVALVFEPLSAGLGEHLFNEIVRAIISADVAVFETSDLNPNVMIEMGVALTWGTRVLPIKEHDRPRPPSDISGQTWADFRDSAGDFVDAEFRPKLVALIEEHIARSFHSLRPSPTESTSLRRRSGFSTSTERRRSRTDLAWGYQTAPVLKTAWIPHE